MKTRILSILSIMTFVFAASCVKEVAPELTVTGGPVSVTAEGGSSRISVTANYEWKASSSASWVSVSPSAGEAGSTGVQISVSASDEPVERTATVTVTCKTLSKTIEVKQGQRDMIEIETKSFKVSSAQQEISVKLKSNVEYSCKIEADWIKKADSKGFDSYTEKFTIAANESYDERNGKIVFTDSAGGQRQEFTVTQLAKGGLILDIDSKQLSCEMQSFDVEVKYNVDFDVVIPQDVDWVSCKKTKGLQSSIYTFTVLDNYVKSSRETTVNFKDKESSLSASFKLSQEAFVEKVELVSEPEVKTEATEGSLEIKVKSNTELIIETDQDWIVYNKTKETATRTYNFYIYKNHSLQSRTAKVSFKAKSNPETCVSVTVIQEAEKANLLSFGFIGNSFTIPEIEGSKSLQAVIDWGDGSEEDYVAGKVHVYGKTGDYTVTVRLLENSSFKFADLVGLKSIDLSQF